MKRKENFKDLVLVVLAVIALFALERLFHRLENTDSFIDEVNFISAAKNFIFHGNYSPGLNTFFDPGVSAGILCNFPSGIASQLGAGLIQIREVSFLFSGTTVCLACGLYLFSIGFRRLQLASLTLAASSLFLNFIPYAAGSLLTLGEIPALSYFTMGLTLLFSAPTLGCFILGVSVFGGKLINIAFCAPIVIFWVLDQRYELKKIAKMAFCFVLPEFIWILVIFICGGLRQGFQWMADFVHTVLFMGSLAAGKTTARIPLFERFNSPALEWVSYPLILKLKIIFLLLTPLILFVIAKYAKKKWQPLRSINFSILKGLVFGEMVFAIWYFCLHPYMWIRHIQIALGVGLGCILWLAAQSLKKPEQRAAGYTLAVVLLLLITRLI